MTFRKAVAPSMGSSMPSMSMAGGMGIPRRKMKSFKIDEISLVDKPAQEGALATIEKRRGGASTKPAAQGGEKPQDGGGKGKFKSGAGAAEIAQYNDGRPKGSQFSDHVRGFEQRQGIDQSSPKDKIAEALMREANGGLANESPNWKDTAAHHYGFRGHDHVESFSTLDPQKAGLINRLQESVGTTGMGKRELDRIIKMVLINGVEDFTSGIAKGDDQIEKAEPFVSALDLSLRSILSDNSLGDNDRLLMLRKSASDFLGAAQAELPELTTYVQKNVDPDVERSADQMNLRQLQKKMNVLNTKLDATLAKLSNRDGEEDDGEFGKGFDDGDHEDGELFKAYKAKKKPPMDAGGDSADMGGMDDAAISDRLHALFGGGSAAKARRHKNPNTDMTGGNDIRAEVNQDNADQLDNEPDPQDPNDPMDDMGKSMKTSEREGLTTTEGEEEDTIAAGAKKPIGGVGKRTRLYETLQIGDRIISKADVGGDMFEILKAQQEETDRIAKALDDERETRELLEFAKVAETELPHLPGRTEDKARLLKNLADYLEPDERRLLSSMLKSGDRSAGTAFKTFGHSVEKARTAGDFQKRVTTIKSRDNCSHTEAMQKARREHPEEFDAYQQGQ